MTIVWIRPGEETGISMEMAAVPSVGQKVYLTFQGERCEDTKHSKYVVESISWDVRSNQWPSRNQAIAYVNLAEPLGG